ncbi:MAG TPA: YbaB/EbfC family nucleoid-associated protein [Epsilonproteobacteria bacterium]|nr:YbaB/EbfC family nucleoid-associated protein [Campylobacterota bacterium]
MFEGLDFSKMSGMMSQMQEKLARFEEEAKKIILTARVGGGMVTMSANGLGEIVDLSIDDSLLEDKESLQILLISAINDVMKMVEDYKKSQAINGILNPFSNS